MSGLVLSSIAFGAGLVVGWNLLPQPAWAKRFYDWVASKFKAKIEG